MDQDQIGGVPGPEGGDMQAATAPEPGDVDIRISNTGQRVRAIAVVVIAVIAIVVVVVWYSGQKAEIERHEQARVDFQKAHTAGYLDFWSKTQVDIKTLKSNMDFELKMKQILSDGPVAYANYVKEKCLPILDQALPTYKSVTVPTEYADKMSAVTKATEQMRDAWNSFSDELLKFEKYFKGKKMLDKTANAWFGAQQSNSEKYKLDGFKYFRLLECVMPGKKIEEIKTTDLNYTVLESCRTDKAGWFRRVAYECLPGLLAKAEEPNDAFATALEGSRGEERMDHSSKFGIEDCLKSTRGELESEIIEKLAVAWADYVKAQNALLGEIDGRLKALR